DNGGTANCSGGKWSVALNPQVWTCWGDHYDAGCDSKWTPGDPADPTPPPTQPSPSGGCERKNIKVDVSALWSDGSPGATFIIDEVGLYFNGKEKKISSANGKPMVSYTISPDMFNWDGVANNGGVMGVSAITEGFESLDYGEHKGTKAINICEERWKTDHLKLELLKKGGEPQPPVPLPPPPSGECHKDNCALDTENYDQPTSCTKFSNDDFGPGGICMSGTQYRGEAPDPYGHTIDYEEDENYKWKTFTGKCPGTPACTSEGKDCEWICRVPPKEQTVGDRTLSVSLNPTKLDVNSAGEMTQDLTFTASIQYYGGKSGDKYNCAIWGEDFRYGEKEEVINDSFTSSIQLVVKKDDFNNNEPSFSTSMNLVCNAGNLWTDNQYVTKSITIPIQKEGGTPPPSGETALIMGDIENFDGVKVKDADGKWSTTKSGNLHFNYSYKYSGTGNTRVHCEVTGFENGISLNGYSQEFSDTGNKLIDGVVQVMIPKDTFLAGSSTQDPKANYKCSILDTVVAVSDSYTFEIEGAVAPPVSRDLTLSIDSVGGEQGTTLYTEADGSLIEDKEVKFDVRFKPKTANETLLCRLAAGNDEFGSWIKQIDNQSGNWQEYNNSTFTIKQGKYNSTKPASLSLECFGGTQLGQPGNKCSAGLDCRYGVLTIDVSSTGTPVVVDPKIEITNPRVDKSGEMKAVCSGDKKGEMKYCDLEGYIHSVTVDVNFDKGSYASGYEDKLRCKALWLEYKEGGDIKFISTLEVRDIEGDSGVVKNIKMTFPEGKDLYIREDIPKLYTDCWIVPINDETPKLVKDLTHFVIEKIIPPSTGGEVVTPEPTPTPPVTTWVDCSGTNFVTATKGTEKLVTAAPGVGVNSGDGRKYRFRASESKWWDEEASQERHEIFVYVVDGNCKIVNRNFTVTWTGGSQTQSSVKDSGEPNTFGMYNPLGSYNVRIDGGTSDSVNGLGMGNVPNSKGHTSFILVFQEMSGQGVIDTENLLASQDLVSPVQAQDQNYPIEGASLTFTDESGKERKIETDANGLFSIDLDTTRKYKMRVEKEGYKTYETDFEPLENVNYNLKIILEAGDLQSYGGFSSMEEISVTHSISKGWNLMTLDVVPAKQDYMASDLLSDMNSYGLFISRIMRYRDGRWDVYRIESQDANDFRLKLGEGYVLKSDKKGEYTVDGKGVGESVPVRLGTGWNLIGIPYSESGYTAVGIIDSANGSGAAVDTVTKWESKWVNVVKEEGLVYGHDFKIDKQGAYFIRNLKAIYWEP
ncbi:carboxypeptidase-like regulatory domain-containing protein, partial [Patescibacteria group bacterium]|nr:carboxypeptidase-like regulatory domain-containing protein [Patescibacteria group bacterium]